MLRDLSSQIVNIHHVPVRTHSSVKQTVASPVKGPETTTTKNTSQDAVWDLFPNYSQQRQNNKKKKEDMHILSFNVISNQIAPWNGAGSVARAISNSATKRWPTSFKIPGVKRRKGVLKKKSKYTTTQQHTTKKTSSSTNLSDWLPSLVKAHRDMSLYVTR